MKAPQGIIDYDPFVLDEDECEQGRLYVDVDNIATLRIDRRKGHVHVEIRGRGAFDAVATATATDRQLIMARARERRAVR